MTAKDVYNKIRLRNIKRAKLKQKKAELALGLKNNYDKERLICINQDINKLEKELKNLK